MENVQISRRSRIAFSLVLFAAGLSFASGTKSDLVAFQASPPIRSSSANARSLTVASLNMARKNNLKEVVRDVRVLFERYSVDILFLQEVEQDVGDPEVIAEELARTFNFHWFFAPTDFWKDGGFQGLA